LVSSLEGGKESRERRLDGEESGLTIKRIDGTSHSTLRGGMEQNGHA